MKKQRNAKKLIVGVTGSFASGKSTVARFLRSCGAMVIDADKIAHEVIRSDTRVRRRLVALFGRGILGSNRKIDRRKLAKIVFIDKIALRKLNRIMHPVIIRLMRQKIKQSGPGVIILDAPLLIESGLRGMVDKLIVVKAGLEKQILRSTLRRAEALRRIHCQIPLKKKISLADFVIDNNGTKASVKKQAGGIYKKLLL